jgi:hypothetical protein
MRRKPGHNRLAQLAKVVREGGHFVAEHSGIDQQHACPALHDNRVALAELALLDQHALRNLPQHGSAPPWSMLNMPSGTPASLTSRQIERHCGSS